MRKTDIGFLDEKQSNLMRHVFNNAQGTVIDLDSAPSATSPLLKANEVGKYGTDLYWRIGNTIYKISSASQITITSDEV